MVLGEAKLYLKPAPKPRWSGATDTDGYLLTAETHPAAFRGSGVDDFELPSAAADSYS